MYLGIRAQLFQKEAALVQDSQTCVSLLRMRLLCYCAPWFADEIIISFTTKYSEYIYTLSIHISENPR